MVSRHLFNILCLSFLILSAAVSAEDSDSDALSVHITGNDRFSDAQIKNMASREFELFETNQREADLFDASYSILQTLRDKGHYFAKVSYTYLPNKHNPTSVLFTISEKSAVTIDTIEITGAKAWETWKDEDITLTIASPIKGLLKHFGVGDLIFRKKDVDNAINSITTAYVLHGYQRVLVGPATLKWNDAKDKVRISIPVVEGPQFTFSNVNTETITDDSNISKENIRKCLGFTKLAGTPFHPRHLRGRIGKIRRTLNDLGYLNAHVDGNYTFDADTHTASANIIIKPGPQFLFNDLIIQGKPLTRMSIFEYYTRRLVHKKSISYYRIEESISYLYRIGVFESIRWKRIIKSHNNDGTVNADIMLDVKELPRNYVDFTLGYGSYELLRTGLTYHNRNLFGVGLDGEIGYDLSMKSQRLEGRLFFGEYYRNSFLILQSSWEEREEPSFDSEVFDIQFR